MVLKERNLQENEKKLFIHATIPVLLHLINVMTDKVVYCCYEKEKFVQKLL